MFNPQRKTNITDILMQEKAYLIHLDKKYKFRHSPSVGSKRYEEEKQQQDYLRQLQNIKKEIHNRLSSDIKRENSRFMKKLIEADLRRQGSSPQICSQRKHFNSFFNLRKEKERIHQQNTTFVRRIDRRGSSIPSLEDLKKQYKQNRKYARNCRKLPTILKHENQFKTKLSKQSLESRVKAQNSNL